MKFQRKTTFYPFPVWEFNLPAGHSCPFANVCKICVDRETGKFERKGDGFRCYAASAERFPGVRKSRWENFEAVKMGEKPEIPKGATHIRIHSSGDFFSQRYFDMWLEVCRENPGVKFWAFTKSVNFWVRRLNDIPSNLTLQASKGGFQDELIDVYNLKYAEVFPDEESALKSGLPIDTNDLCAMEGKQSFALIDNFSKNGKRRNQEDSH